MSEPERHKELEIERRRKKDIVQATNKLHKYRHNHKYRNAYNERNRTINVFLFLLLLWLLRKMINTTEMRQYADDDSALP